MNRQGIILIVLVAIIAFIVWQYFLPAFEKVSLLRSDVATWQEKLDNTLALSKKLEELKIKYEDLAGEAEKVAQAVPVGQDLPGLLVQLEDLSSRSGLVLGDVIFDAGDEKKNKQLSVNGAKELAIILSLSGNQGSIKSFLKSVEDNLRLMDITAVNFGEKETGEYTGLNFKVSMNAYYR